MAKKTEIIFRVSYSFKTFLCGVQSFFLDLYFIYLADYYDASAAVILPSQGSATDSRSQKLVGK